MNFGELATCIPITIICYLVGIAVKQCDQINDTAIPVIVGIAGGVLGIIALFAMPSYPATDIITAMAVGIESGLAATGVNQIFKQIEKYKNGEA